MEKETLKLDRNRKRVQYCPCGKSNRDGKFVPFRNHEKYGYCHSCGETFFPESNIPIEREIEIPKPVSQIDYALVSRAGRNYSQNNFIQWLKTIFDDEAIKEVIKKYLIGTSNHWDGSTVFWQIDKFERVRGGKIMLYNASNGKRVKVPYNYINWVHSVVKIPHFNLKQCLFGEHLLNENPNKVVAIVESEKTAIYMSVVFPEKLWLATGNKGNFKYQLLKSLYGRTIEAFPDKSEFDQWLDVATLLNNKGFNITVNSILEDSDFPDGSDLVDYMESGFTIEKPIQPKEMNTEYEDQVKKLADKNPTIYKLIDVFGLTDDLGFEIRTYK